MRSNHNNIYMSLHTDRFGVTIGTMHIMSVHVNRSGVTIGTTLDDGSGRLSEDGTVETLGIDSRVAGKQSSRGRGKSGALHVIYNS
jgi:hypothetical protein